MSLMFWLGREGAELGRYENDAWLSQAIAYGYEEPQAGTEAHNLANRNSAPRVRETVDMEADGFVTVHGLSNSPLGPRP